MNASLGNSSLRQEFSYRRQVALKGGYEDVTPRLVGLLEWTESVPFVARLLKELRRKGHGEKLLDEAKGRRDFPSPVVIRARSMEEIASVGLVFLKQAQSSGALLCNIAHDLGIHSERGRSRNEYGEIEYSASSYSEAIVSRFIVPLLDYVEQRLPVDVEAARKADTTAASPAIIHDSLKKFRSEHRKAGARCFIMMRFGDTVAHVRIEDTIKRALKKHGLAGMLARDKEFHEDLYPNIQTYMHGCDFGIAVFERLKTDEFNPNVALEVGYMFGLKKQVLLLKDQTLRALHTDLVGKLYKEFDPQHPERTIPGQIDHWLTDKGLG